MTKTEIPCSCGCGKMLMRKESDIARNTTGLFFYNKEHAGRYYAASGHFRGMPQQRGYQKVSA